MLILLLRMLNMLIGAYMTVLLVRVVLDWVMLLTRLRPRGVMGSIASVIYSLTEPPLRWLRQYVKPIALGNISLDVSFMVLYVGLIALQILI